MVRLQRNYPRRHIFSAVSMRFKISPLSLKLNIVQSVSQVSSASVVFSFFCFARIKWFKTSCLAVGSVNTITANTEDSIPCLFQWKYLLDVYSQSKLLKTFDQKIGLLRPKSNKCPIDGVGCQLVQNVTQKKNTVLEHLFTDYFC